MKSLPRPVYTGAVIVMIVIAIVLSIKNHFDQKKESLGTPPTTSAVPDTGETSHEYLTSVTTSIPNSGDTLSIELYTDSIVPTIHGPSTNGEAQMRQFNLAFGEGITDLMSIATYNEPTNTVTLGEDFITLKPTDIVRIEDVNFDGRPDLGILNGIGYGGVNLYYGYYLNTKVTDSSESDTNEILGDFIREENLQDVSNPFIDPQTKKITSSFRSGPEWYSQSWKYENGAFTDLGQVKGSEIN